MANNIQSLNKILVDVPSAKAEEFLGKYYRKDNPQDPTRLKDYDNKLAFLHGEHKIFTQGELFGGSDLTVGEHKSIDIKDGSSTVTYTLVINDGKISLEGSKYTASSWGTCAWTASTVSGGGTYLYETTYNLSVTPSNNFKVSVNHGTTEIAITGVKVKDTADQAWDWIAGGEATVSGGIASVGGTPVNYTNANIVDASYTISSGEDHYKGQVTASNKLTPSNSQYTLSVDTQTAVIYYHEKGKSTVSEKTISSDPNSVTATGIYEFLCYVGETWSEASATGTKKANLPITSNITFTYKNKQSYGWFACPTSWLGTEPATGMPIVFTQYTAAGDKGADGGWYYAFDGNDAKIRFTHIGVEYTLFRTENPVLATAYYRVSK